jgi:hypothetical protein
VIGEVGHARRPAESGAGADDEADLGLEVHPARRAERRRVLGRRLALAARPPDRGAGHHDRAGPAVVADRHVLPVGRQRGRPRPEDPADVAGVVLARVEVDVVADRERQVQPDVAQRVRHGQVPVRADEVGEPGPDLGPASTALGHEAIQRGLGKHPVAEQRRQV